MARNGRSALLGSESTTRLIEDLRTQRSRQNWLCDARNFVGQLNANPHDCDAAHGHPLGFAVVRWKLSADQTLRLHIWAPDRDAVRDIDHRHDHIWHLTSLVLVGQIRDHSLEVVPGALGVNEARLAEIHQVDGSDEVLPLMQGVDVTESGERIISPGEIYTIEPGAFHWSEPARGLVCTLVLSKDTLTSRARTILAPQQVGRPPTPRVHLHESQVQAFTSQVLEALE